MKIANPLLAGLYEKRDKFQESMDTITAAAADREDDSLTEAETANFSDADTAIKGLDVRITELVAAEEARSKANELRSKAEASDGFSFENGNTVIPAEVKTETYAADSRHSYLSDLYKFQCMPGTDRDAEARIRAYGEEVKASKPEMFASDTTAVSAFFPPAVLINDYVNIARSRAVVTNLVPKTPWQGYVDHKFPVVTTSVTVAEQASQNSAVNDSSYAATTSVTATAFTIAGSTDVSEQQLQSPSGFSWESEITSSLVEEYYLKLEDYILNKATIGLFNYATANATYTDASPTLTEFISSLADVMSQIRDNRKRPATAIILGAERWLWALTQNDTTNRPLIPSSGSAVNAPGDLGTIGAAGLAGHLLTVPVYVADAVPNTYTQEATPSGVDKVLVARLDDARLAEGPLQVQFDRGPGFKSGTITYRVMGFAAFHGRIANSYGVIQGTGLKEPF